MPTLTARSRFAPYAASPPVNGNTSPTRSVNAHFLDCSAARVVPADPTDVASAAVTATITTATSAVSPLFLTIPPLPSTECHHTARYLAPAQVPGYAHRVTEMRLYDIRVTVERIEGRSVCGLAGGDFFEVTGSNGVRIPEGKHFCLYALQSVLPLIPAKQRRLPAEDWLEQDSLVCCPDPDERVVMRIERVGERTLVTEERT